MAQNLEFDVRDLESVRKAARTPDVILGDDWVEPQALGENELAEGRRRRGFFSLRHSPLARKIITFNLIALMILIAGILYLNPSRDNLAFQRVSGLVKEAELVVDVMRANLPADTPVDLSSPEGRAAIAGIAEISLRDRIQVLVFDLEGNFIDVTTGTGRMSEVIGLERVEGSTAITDAFSKFWDWGAALIGFQVATPLESRELVEVAGGFVPGTIDRGTQVHTVGDQGQSTFMVAAPILQNDETVGVAVIASASGELDRLIAMEREQVLRVFLIGIAVSIGLSLVLASTIANPCASTLRTY